MTSALRRIGTAISALAAVAVIALVVMVGAAAFAGYRPVLITSGSMDGYASEGSVVVAAPTENVQVGDVLVMQRDGRATVTHRVIEIQRQDGRLFALTKGDANEQPDPSPYALDNEELVGRDVVPHLGSVLLAAGDPIVALVVVTIAVLIVTVMALRKIWQPVSASTLAAPPARRHQPSGRRRLAVATIGLVGLFGGGVAWSVYSATDSIAGNVFSTPDCFDAQLGTVQHGQTVNSVDGVQTVAIAAVDPTMSFLTVSTRSNSNEPADTMVQARLLNPTTIELTRRTDAGPLPIVVDWSVVEYSCGLSVQRGMTAGNDLNSLDIAISSVDPGASFVLLSSVGAT